MNPVTLANPKAAAAAVEAFNEATGYRLDPQEVYGSATVENMCVVAMFRGRLDVVKQLKEAFPCN